ncbi:MAG: hypothetical protein D6729_10985, partial [Deltaproteobacteria bacterium]
MNDETQAPRSTPPVEGHPSGEAAAPADANTPADATRPPPTTPAPEGADRAESTDEALEGTGARPPHEEARTEVGPAGADPEAVESPPPPEG